MKVVVIGGGPAGMMAAISSAKCGNDTIILEKMNMLGKKLLITGKGRCNITSSIHIDEFIKNIPGNGMFLYSAFNKFDNIDIINLLEAEGVETKVERGNRVFPVSDSSKDVQKAFINLLNKYNVKIETSAIVKEITIKDGIVSKVKYEQNCIKKEIYADKVILATGGKSYPGTGSTGDGYIIAEKLGHTVTKISPSLVPLIVSDEDVNLCKKMQGLSLKNVKIKIEDKKSEKIIYEDFGEMLFTHFGVSGPTILSASSHLLRYKNVEELLGEGNIKLIIDLKPALTVEKLHERIIRDFLDEKNKAFKNSLEKLLPKKMIDVIVELTEVNPNKKVNEITKNEREKLVYILKNYTVTIKNFSKIDEAIVTAGGINIKEINPKTMESKIVKGLFFAGELIDVDAYTGGFNLQIAYSTGFVAGQNN